MIELNSLETIAAREKFADDTLKEIAHRAVFLVDRELDKKLKAMEGKPATSRQYTEAVIECVASGVREALIIWEYSTTAEAQRGSPPVEVSEGDSPSLRINMHVVIDEVMDLHSIPEVARPVVRFKIINEAFEPIKEMLARFVESGSTGIDVALKSRVETELRVIINEAANKASTTF